MESRCESAGEERGLDHWPEGEIWPAGGEAGALKEQLAKFEGVPGEPEPVGEGRRRGPPAGAPHRRVSFLA